MTRWGVTEHFRLNEGGTGARTGFIAATSLTNTGGATQAAALAANLSNSTQFAVASNQRLTVADTAILKVTSNITIIGCIFATLASKGADRYLIHKGSGITATTLEYAVLYSNSQDRFRVSIGDNAGATVTNLNFSSLGSPALDTTYFLVFGYDAVSGLIFACGNGGVIDTATTSGRFPPATAGAFAIGERSGANRWDGKASDMTFCKSPTVGYATVVAEMNAYVRNAGAGAQYPWSI